MIARFLLIAVLIPVALHGQLALFAVSGSAETSVNGTYDYGLVASGVADNVVFRIRNTGPSTASVQVSFSGINFQILSSPPSTLIAGSSFDLTIEFYSIAPMSYSGNLSVNGTITKLTATVLPNAPGGGPSALPVPIFGFDATNMNSGEQHTISIGLPQPAPFAMNGNLSLTFHPSGNLVTDDKAIQFVAISKRVISFTIAQGSTIALINSQPNAIFSTGTTAGTITFTMDLSVYGVSPNPFASINLAAAPISIQSASATSRANDLDITITGFDNTYTTGAMSFTFYDRSGAPLGSAVSADFTGAFRSFYQNQTSGSAFLMRVSFPVTGDVSLIGGADVSLSNSAGNARTQRLNFP